MRPVRDDSQRQAMPHSTSAERILPDASPHYRAPLNDVSAADRRLPWCSDSGAELLYPDRLVWPTPWAGHIPFAAWLIEAIQPRMVVELGVHSGNSYCAFLQAIQFLSLSAQCYGIDHWQGDAHSDYYGDDVYAELCAYHHPRYGTFSTLVRSTFEDALGYFADESIDLLHIDGCHTYDAVSRDFVDWLPKLSERAVVLFHDINVRERNFGAWRFWDEMAERYPTFSFIHSHGLGVAYVGSDPAPVLLRPLIGAADSDTVRRVRAYFARLGTSLLDRYERTQLEKTAAAARAGEGALESARTEARTLADANLAARVECEKANARVELLERELAVVRGELARRVDLAESRQSELAAARADMARAVDATMALQQERFSLRVEAARALETTSAVKSDLDAAIAETARQAEWASDLRQELQQARVELARAGERVDALGRELTAARDDTVRQAALTHAVERQHEALQSELASHGSRLASYEQDLRHARAENARDVEALEAERATAARLTERMARLEQALAGAQAQISEALAQRDRSSLLLRQQIAMVATLQRELNDMRQANSASQRPPRDGRAT